MHHDYVYYFKYAQVESMRFFELKRYLDFKKIGQCKVTEADLTISKTIELLAKKEGKKNGYKNGKGD